MNVEPGFTDRLQRFLQDGSVEGATEEEREKFSRLAQLPDVFKTALLAGIEFVNELLGEMSDLTDKVNALNDELDRLKEIEK